MENIRFLAPKVIDMAARISHPISFLEKSDNYFFGPENSTASHFELNSNIEFHFLLTFVLTHFKK